jgi:hypothetical protein
VQAWLAGREPARALEDLFSERWRRDGGPPLELGDAGPPRCADPGLAARGRDVGSRSAGPIPQPASNTIREVGASSRMRSPPLTVSSTSRRSIFSSRRIREALVRRMRAPAGRGPQIVIVVNEHAEALKEEVAVGLRQAQNLEVLRTTAAASRLPLGCYFSLCDGANETFRATYIPFEAHDRRRPFFTVGSANLTNRSLGLDSELHAAWEHEGDSGARRHHPERAGEPAGRTRGPLLGGTRPSWSPSRGSWPGSTPSRARADARLKRCLRPPRRSGRRWRSSTPTISRSIRRRPTATTPRAIRPTSTPSAAACRSCAVALGGVGAAVLAGLVARHINKRRSG